MSLGKFIQFELWHDCNNNCKFCHSKELGDIDKIQSLTFIKSQLDLIDFNSNIGTIGLIGGELFDHQLDNLEVKKFFYQHIIQRIIFLLINNIVKRLCIATSLIYRDNEDLSCFLDYLQSNNVLDKCIVCTSYDTLGRFHSHEDLEKWENNMSFINAKYPSARLHTEMIVTGDLILKIMSDEFNLQKFKFKFNTSIDFISPHIYSCRKLNDYSKAELNSRIGYFFPYRHDFLKFINEFMIKEDILDYSTFLSNRIRADEYFFVFNNKHYLAADRVKTDGMFNKANIPLKINVVDGYLDSSIRMEDDVNLLLNREA